MQFIKLYVELSWRKSIFKHKNCNNETKNKMFLSNNMEFSIWKITSNSYFIHFIYFKRVAICNYNLVYIEELHVFRFFGIYLGIRLESYYSKHLCGSLFIFQFINL